MPIRRPSSATIIAILVTIVIATQTGVVANAAPSRTSKSQRTAWQTRSDTSAPQKVRAIAVTGTSASSVSVAWSRSRDNVAVTGYDVLLNGTPRAKTTATSFALQQLACGTGYRVGVDAYDAAGNKSSPTSTTVSTSPCVDVTAPSAPTGVKLLAATDSSAVLSWTPSTDDVGVVEYGLYLSGLVAGTGLLVGRVSEASATLSNLDCGTTYGLGIDAADAAGNRSTRGTATFTTAACVDKTPPSAPSALAVTGATQDQIAVKWTASTDNVGVTGYGRYVASNQVGSNTTTAATFGSLQCGTTYILGIDATDAAGNRSTKSTMSAATAACSETPPATGDKTAPSAPQSLGVSSATQSAITLSWGSASDNVGVTNYRVYRDGTMIGQGPGSGGGYTNTWTDSSRACGTSYQYAVEAQDAAGNTGPRGTVTAATAACSETPPATGDKTAPSAPQSLGVSSATQSAITLSWGSASDNVGVTNYRVYRDGTMIGQGPGSGGGYTNTWTDSSRTCGTSYQYAVEAQDAAGNTGPKAVRHRHHHAMLDRRHLRSDDSGQRDRVKPNRNQHHAQLVCSQRQRRGRELRPVPEWHARRDALRDDRDRERAELRNELHPRCGRRGRHGKPVTAGSGDGIDDCMLRHPAALDAHDSCRFESDADEPHVVVGGRHPTTWASPVTTSTATGPRRRSTASLSTRPDWSDLRQRVHPRRRRPTTRQATTHPRRRS